MLSELDLSQRVELYRLALEEADKKGTIYSYLYDILYELAADRVSILQKHPEDKDSVGVSLDKQYMSTSFEIISSKDSINRLKDEFQFVKLSDVSNFYKSLKNNKILYFKNVNQIRTEKSKYFKITAIRRKVTSVIFVQIADINDVYKGTICIESIYCPFINLDSKKEYLINSANNIAQLLNPYISNTDTQKVICGIG